MKYSIKVINNVDIDITNQLLNIWEKAVRETHYFLTEQDITSIREQVRSSLKVMNILAAVTKDKQIIKAFLAVKENKIEMLFVEPTAMRTGLGQMLISFALNEYDARYVDVNLDNHSAFEFYKHIGFKVCGYSKYDDFNNPFPIVHMKKEIP